MFVDISEDSKVLSPYEGIKDFSKLFSIQSQVKIGAFWGKFGMLSRAMFSDLPTRGEMRADYTKHPDPYFDLGSERFEVSMEGWLLFYEE